MACSNKTALLECKPGEGIVVRYAEWGYSNDQRSRVCNPTVSDAECKFLCNPSYISLILSTSSQSTDTCGFTEVTSEVAMACEGHSRCSWTVPTQILLSVSHLLSTEVSICSCFFMLLLCRLEHNSVVLSLPHWCHGCQFSMDVRKDSFRTSISA